jgi:DNA repair protein RadA/Sms
MLIEVQALVSRAGFGAPRRVAQGVDANRVSMLLAILSRHADLALADYDVFVNLVGGIDIAETATDLPLALALVSSLKDRPVSESLASFGELGLTGEVRPVAYGDERVREAVKLGFTRVMLPRENLPRMQQEGVKLQPVMRIGDALRAAFE